MFCKKMLLKIAQNSQESTCVETQRLSHVCFLVNFAKFLRTLEEAASSYMFILIDIVST